MKKNVKATRQNTRYILYRRITIKIRAQFLSEAMQNRRQQNDISKMMKKIKLTWNSTSNNITF